MSTIPKISEKAIRSRVGAQSFERGQAYHRSGAIFNARRQGRTLKARCEGSQAEAYRVRVTFDEAGAIAEAECSCPVGSGGSCKHVAALLLTWRARPEEFVEVEELGPSLERRSKAELIALIKQMLRREPDLEVLLETPLPGTGGRRMPVSPETYRRQAASAFRGYGYDDYGSGYGVAEALKPILEIGEGFLARGDHASASAVFEGLVDAATDNYESIDDEGGETNDVIMQAIAGLGQCLAHLEDDPARREAILKALFDAFDFARNYDGDAEEDIPGLIAEHATEEERRTVAGWLRDRLSERARDEYSRFAREAYARFLIELERDTLGDEDYLRICRESGLTADLVDRLLALRRFEEAFKELERADDHQVLALADVFVRHKQGDAAERVVRERAGKAKDHDTRFLEWLKRRAAARRDRATVRELTEAIFRAGPGFERYKELRQLAREEGGWDALRSQLLDLLKKSHRADLIRVYLDEGEIDRAIEAVKAERGSRPTSGYGYPGYYGPGMRLEVAKVAEKSRPRSALEIYRGHAEELIESRGRERYQEACRFLKKVKGLYEALGEPKAWADYVAALRERNRSLRALQEELTAAKL